MSWLDDARRQAEVRRDQAIQAAHAEFEAVVRDLEALHQRLGGSGVDLTHDPANVARAARTITCDGPRVGGISATAGEKDVSAVVLHTPVMAIVHAIAQLPATFTKEAVTELAAHVCNGRFATDALRSAFSKLAFRRRVIESVGPTPPGQRATYRRSPMWNDYVVRLGITDR